MDIMTTDSPEETMLFAEKLADLIHAGDIIALEGDLGAGKTVFVKGLGKGLGVDNYQHVNSPTFVILKEYSGRIPLYHFDVYRLDEEHFAESLDYRRYFYGDGVSVVEWADKVRELFPDDYLEIRIHHEGPSKRRFEFRPHGKNAGVMSKKMNDIYGKGLR